MENTTYSDELQHHGTKGMRWGIRRYQNKDGSLTPAGQKRYNKEVEKLKKETEKVKEAEKAAANRKKVQDKFDKLDAKKQKLEERKKALKGEDADVKKSKEEAGETLEQRRERLLKSTDPKELYKGKDDLTYQELSDRINRIDLESKLQSRIPQEEHKTAADYMDGLKKNLDSATNLYKSVDNAYSTVANSAIGKMVAKQLGIETPKKGFNPEEFIKKVRNNEATAQEIETGSKALKNLETIEQDVNRRANKAKNDADFARKQAEAEKEARAAEARKKEAQKQVDEYNKRWRKGESDDKVGEPDTGTYRKKGDDIPDNKTATGKGSKTKRVAIEQVDRFEGTGQDVTGEGTSRYRGKNNDTVIDAEEGVDYRYVDMNSSTATSAIANVSNTAAYDMGRRVAGLLGTSDNTKNSESSNSRTSQSEDYSERLRRAADALDKAAKKSSEAASRTSEYDDYVQELLKRNKDRLDGK